jgi:nucleoside-diphosphate-sugar epimerase
MTPKRFVVTGGGGFVGKALCRALIQQGHEVLSLARGAYPELAAEGIRTAQVDLSSDSSGWWELLKGAHGVFHTAAKVDMFGRYEDFYRTNVRGTDNVIAACRKAGVLNLVFTSSPSVIHDGSDLKGIDESYPYPDHFEAFYPQTKALAEQKVRAAHSSQLRTVSLRPHLIWGPGDTNLIPTVVERARVGRLTQVGDGTNLVDLSYIDDCVQAHLCAMRALDERPEVVGGKVYFISQGDPVPLWGWIHAVLNAHGVAPVRRVVSKKVAMTLAAVIETASRILLSVGIETKPFLTRFLVSEMSTSHYFSIEAAKRDLGYEPTCTIAQALEKTFSPHGSSLESVG